MRLKTQFWEFPDLGKDNYMLWSPLLWTTMLDYYSWLVGWTWKDPHRLVYWLCGWQPICFLETMGTLGLKGWISWQIHTMLTLLRRSKSINWNLVRGITGLDLQRPKSTWLFFTLWFMNIIRWTWSFPTCSCHQEVQSRIRPWVMKITTHGLKDLQPWPIIHLCSLKVIPSHIFQHWEN